jgi:hypothetical protein
LFFTTAPAQIASAAVSLLASLLSLVPSEEGRHRVYAVVNDTRLHPSIIHVVLSDQQLKMEISAKDLLGGDGPLTSLWCHPVDVEALVDQLVVAFRVAGHLWAPNSVAIEHLFFEY